jgi:hypothetical protein
MGNKPAMNQTSFLGSVVSAVSAVAITTGLLALSHRAAAQTLPPIYANTPVELVPAQTIATFPANTFLENIAVAADGTLYVTSHENGKILRITPDGEQSDYATVAGKVAGIAFATDGSLIVPGWNSEGVPTVFRVDVNAPVESRVETLMSLPEAMFLNGIVRLADDRFLIADSYRGAIWELDAAQRMAKIWLEHPLLARRTPDSQIPAANGMKIFQNTLYVSNTDRMLMLQIPIDGAGNAGEPQTWAEQVNIDDFAFDAAGNLYGATHIYNSLVRITPSGQVTTLAEAEQGMTGSTAVAFGQTAADRTSIYVVTNGGMFLPPSTGVEPAEVVRLNVEQVGDSLSNR